MNNKIKLWKTIGIITAVIFILLLIIGFKLGYKKDFEKIDMPVMQK